MPGVWEEENLDEEGASWGLDIRKLADSFTFDELEQLKNDGKIKPEDYNGAVGYLQAWADQHPNFLKQRDFDDENSFGYETRKAIRDKYLNEKTMKKIKEANVNPKELAAIEAEKKALLLKKQAIDDKIKNMASGTDSVVEENEEANPIIAEMKRMIKAYREGYIGAGDVINGLEEILYDGIPNDDTVDSPGASAYTVDMGPGNPSTMENMMESYMKERGSDNLMEHMDKHRKRAKLMEGATQTLFKLFNAGKTDAEVRALYFDQYKKEMPESFIAKLRNSWESLRKTKLDLTLADKEAEGFETIQPAIHGMEDGMEGGMEEKQLASGLFNENKK
jgi:hypothetical protein